MSPSLVHDGYMIHRGVFSAESIQALRAETERVAKANGTVCVRHLRNHSVLFAELARSSELSALLPTGLSPVRSLLFDKTPKQNWPVSWHQDVSIAVQRKIPIDDGYRSWSVKDSVPHVQPPDTLLAQMVTVRIHLDETGADNGALMILPGTHRNGKLTSDIIASLTKDQSESVVICECQPGDVLLMSPLILHASRRSARPGHRRVLHFEYARPNDLHPDLSWHEEDPC